MTKPEIVSFSGARYEQPVQALVRILFSLTEPQRSRRNVVSCERIASSRTLQRRPPSQSGHLNILIRLRDLRVSVRVKSSSAFERSGSPARDSACKSSHVLAALFLLYLGLGIAIGIDPFSAIRPADW